MQEQGQRLFADPRVRVGSDCYRHHGQVRVRVRVRVRVCVCVCVCVWVWVWVWVRVRMRVKVRGRVRMRVAVRARVQEVVCRQVGMLDLCVWSYWKQSNTCVLSVEAAKICFNCVCSSNKHTHQTGAFNSMQ